MHKSYKKFQVGVTLIALALALSILFPSAVVAKEGGETGKFVLARATFGDEICSRFVASLNKYLEAQPNFCNQTLPNEFSEFTRLKWEKIPFDLNMAEKAIKSLGFTVSLDRGRILYNQNRAQKRWDEWLASTKTLRESGKVEIHLAKIDIDNDNITETILRLNPGGRFRVEQPQKPLNGCDSSQGELYVIDSGKPKTIETVNNVISSASDIFYDANTEAFYLLEWVKHYAASSVADYLPEQGPIRKTRGTGGVIIKTLSPDSKSQSFNPGAQLCVIDWIPK